MGWLRADKGKGKGYTACVIQDIIYTVCVYTKQQGQLSYSNKGESIRLKGETKHQTEEKAILTTCVRTSTGDTVVLREVLVVALEGGC